MTHDELIEFLDGEQNEYGLDSMATHGFLTATIVGKPLPNWLNALFEGHVSRVSNEVQDALTAWRNSLLAQLKDENPISLPFYQDEEELDLSPDSDVSAWAVGFVDAMYAEEADDWFADEDTEEDVAMLTLPMVVMSGIDEEDEELKALRASEATLLQMVDGMEDNLTELFLLFHTDD